MGSLGRGNREAGADVDGGAGVGDEGFGKLSSSLLPRGSAAYGEGPGTPCDQMDITGDFW